MPLCQKPLLNVLEQHLETVLVQEVVDPFALFMFLYKPDLTQFFQVIGQFGRADIPQLIL